MIQSLGVLFLVSSLSAAKAGSQGYFYLETGGYIAGEVLADDGHKVEIRVRESGEVQSVPYERFTGKTQYKLKSNALADGDGNAHMQLASFAFEKNLFREARSHYRSAARMSTSLRSAAANGLAKVEAAVLEERFADARHAYAAGDLARAEEIFADLFQHPDPLVTERAGDLFDSLFGEDRTRPTIGVYDHPRLAAIQRLYDRASERNRDGLLHSKSANRSTRDYTKAFRDLRKGLRLLDRIRDRYGKDAPLMQAAAQMEKKLLDLQATVALNQSSLHIVQQSFRNALNVINESLAFDPTNKALHEARVRVEQAVSNASSGVLVGSI